MNAAAAKEQTAAAWAGVQLTLRRSLGTRLYDQWIRPAELVGRTDGAVTLRLPSGFLADWVRAHYAERILLAFRAELDAVAAVEIVSGAPAPEPLAIAAAPEPRAAEGEGLRLNPRFTFDRFVAAPSNRVALEAAQAFATPGPVRFSPLFLHGGVGNGKTHLLHAIGHRFAAEQPGARIVAMSAERFMFEFVSAMRERDTLGFKARLRSADLLLIDDVQFIAGKEATQEEFFHTISAVVEAGRRLAITADRAPEALDGIERRLTSRLGMGLAADIAPPAVALRRAVLGQRAGEGDVAVPGAVLDLLAERVTASVRAVEGALGKLVAYATLSNEAITLDFAQSVLADALRAHERRIGIDEIQRAVSQHFGIRQSELVSARRARAIARPRQIAMYLAKQITTRSLPEIGRRFGGRDHSTVIHAVRRIEALRASDGEVDEAVRALLHRLDG